MKLYTSSYKIAGDHPRGVGITQGYPRFLKTRVRMYKRLAPSWALVRGKLSEQAFESAFRSQVLDHLDPKQVVLELGESTVMLCYEAPGEFCHRRIVAAWFREHGYEVEELPADWKANGW